MTTSLPEYGKEEVVPEQVIALSPTSRDVRRAEEFAFFEVRTKKQEYLSSVRGFLSVYLSQ